MIASLHPKVVLFRHSGITSACFWFLLTMLLEAISYAMCAYLSAPNLPLQKFLGFSTHQVSVYITLKVSAQVPPFQICPRYPVPSLLFQLHPASERSMCVLWRYHWFLRKSYQVASLVLPICYPLPPIDGIAGVCTTPRVTALRASQLGWEFTAKPGNQRASLCILNFDWLTYLWTPFS